MALAPFLLHYIGIVWCMAFAALGVAIGQGIAAAHACQALSRQELAVGPVRRSLLIGLAFLESGCVFSLVICLLFLFNMPFTPTLASGLAVFGAGFGLGTAACVVGIASGFVVASSVEAMARQPFLASRISSFTMLAQMLLEAPTVFAFILCFLIKNGLSADMSLALGVQLMVGGIIIGLCSIGPAIGQSIYASRACDAMGRSPDMYGRMFSFSFVVQAIIETPIIFALLLALIIMMRGPITMPLAEYIALLAGAAAAFGLGSTGAAVGTGYVAGRAVTCMGATPEQYTAILRMTIFCQAVIDTALIYSLITAFLLIIRAT